MKAVGVSIIKQCSGTSLGENDIYVRLNQQWNWYKHNDPPFQLMIDEQYLNAKNDVQSAVTYWLNRYNLTTHDELSVLALAMLNVNPSEASVERSFSKQKFIHTPLRNKLHQDTVEALMFIKVNVIALGVIDDGVNDMIRRVEELYESE